MNFNRSPVVAVGCGCKEGVAHSTQFVSRETYLDVVCSCDGMTLYFMILRDQFPDAEIVTWFLGSDQNEPLFAWIRVSLSLGRRMNLDDVVLHSVSPCPLGMEKRNVRSGFTLPEVEPPIAHTQGRSVLRDEFPLPSAPTKEKPVAENRIWFSRDIDVAKLVKTMEKATEDCIAKGRKHRLPVFVDAQNKAERSGYLLLSTTIQMTLKMKVLTNPAKPVNPKTSVWQTTRMNPREVLPLTSLRRSSEGFT